MSQHTFKHDQYDILCGWDRPLQGFFLVIEDVNNCDEVAYSNIYEMVSHPATFEPYLEVLKRFSIPMPDGLLVALEQDKAENKGNSITNW